MSTVTVCIASALETLCNCGLGIVFTAYSVGGRRKGGEGRGGEGRGRGGD